MVATVPCPVCRRPVSVDADRPTAFPFCGSRCRTLDLGAWATDRYVIAGKPVMADPRGTDHPQDDDSE